MVDIHCHVLPGLDDGAPDIDTSIEMARVAAADGVETIVATPHVREDHPYPLDEIEIRTRVLNERLEEAQVPVRIVPGAEVALSKAVELDDAELGRLCLGSADWLLVESPYTHATDLLEQDLFNLQVRGFRLVLAHPERSPSFAADLGRLERLAERGILCSVTAGSLEGRFGRRVRRTAVEMLRAGLVHDVASDAHDAERRSPVLSAGLSSLEGELPRLAAIRDWLVRDVPGALLTGATPPPQPARLSRKRGPLGGLLAKLRG